MTSIVPDLQINELPSDNPARYSGMLIRNPGLEPLQSVTFRQLANEFAGNRYVDRFVVSRGKIVRMDVWNDSAEILLVRAGLAKM